MSKKWTRFKLTDNQLKFLSQICNNRQRNHFQPTLDVLERNGLIHWNIHHRRYFASTDGHIALNEARREGW